MRFAVNVLRPRVLCGVALILSGLLAEARPPRARTNAQAWKREVQAGMNMTEGNKDAVQTRAQVSVAGRGDGWESDVLVRGEIGEVEGSRNRERLYAELRHQKQWTPRAYLAYRMEALYDAIADLDYRVVASPSFGYAVLKEAVQTLRGEVGPAWVVERKAGERESYPALRLAEYYEGRVTTAARLLQGIEYVPEVRLGDGSYLLKAFVELKADLDRQLKLHVRLESEYDSDPADGKKNQDTTFSTSVGFTF